MAARFGQNGSPQRAHARIHDRHVNRALRKVPPGLPENEACFADLEGLDLVGEVHEACSRSDSQDDAFHDPDIGIR